MRVVCTVLVLGILLVCFPEKGLFEHEDGEDGHSHGGHDDDRGHKDTDDHGDHDQEPFYQVNKYLLQLELTALENGQEPESIGYGQTETVVHSLLERFECSERISEEECEEVRKLIFKILHTLNQVIVRFDKETGLLFFR